MNQTLFPILPAPAPGEAVDTHVSFSMFAAYLANKTKTEKTLRKGFYEFVLQHFDKYPEVLQPVSAVAIQHYTGLLELLSMSLFPPLSDEEDTLWALSIPATDTVFYSTPAFHKLTAPGRPEGMQATATEAEKTAFRSSLDQVKYALILERLYNIEPFVKDDIIYVSTDTTTGLPKYYCLHINNRFVQVLQTAQSPKTDPATLQQQVKKAGSLCEMESTLPLHAYRFEGFSIITATDITERYALHKMRSAIIGHTAENYEKTYDRVLFLLKALCGIDSIQFGLLPFLKLNDRPVSFYDSYTHSIAINVARQQKVDEQVFLAWISSQYQNPQITFFKDCQDCEAMNDEFYRSFAQAGLTSYALAPVYHNDKLAGLLEVHSVKTDILKERFMPRLEAALPILAQLMHNTQVEFGAGIQKVIKMNFTSIQSSVQWKFNEVAWHYLRKKVKNVQPNEMEAIRFNDVYPLYGAIDIRNSTIERNNALYKDMQSYFSLLQETLHAIHRHDQNIVNDLITEAEELHRTDEYLSENDEVVITRFMERVRIFLQSYAIAQPTFVQAVGAYFDALDPVSGVVYEHRRALETSIGIINGSINKYLDLAQTVFQQSYPVYFEKFRTDGVEYDMYIGQSIHPQQPYHERYLHQLRLWQLRSMAAIAKLVHASLPSMPIQLHTTQMIYVNAYPIDLSFRTDEKRFDAEGGYNLRYHIVKKRIDKVHVKATGERLTQPGKIAIVFSQKDHEEEYRNYMIQLQQEGLLMEGIELLELEELQGVNGLTALRADVRLEENNELVTEYQDAMYT